MFKTIAVLFLGLVGKLFGRVMLGIGVAQKQNNSVPELNTQLRRHLDIAKVLERDVSRDVKILDVGCGQGLLAKTLKENGFTTISGVDWLPPEKVSFKECLRSYSTINLNECESLGFPKSSFDVIICSDVLEHLENPSRIIRQMTDILKPEGQLVITIPNATNIFQRWRFFLTGNSTRYKVEKPNSWGHITFFTSNIMKSLLQRSGLEIFKTYGGGCYHDGLWIFPNKFMSGLWSYNLIYIARKSEGLSPPQ